MYVETLYEVERDGEVIKVKKCNRCLKYKRVGDYYKSRTTNGSSLYQNYCKKCVIEKRKKSRIDN